MAQTVKELEKERAELLKAIENQAQSISTSEDTEHTLKDWLNAAEDVMPSNNKSQTHVNPSINTSQATQTNQTLSKPANKTPRSSFFMTIIVGTLLLTIIGVIYIGYISINNQLKEAKETNESLVMEINLLKDQFIQLEHKISEIEQEDTKPQALKSKKVQDENSRLKTVEKQIQQIDVKLEKILSKLEVTPAPVSTQDKKIEQEKQEEQKNDMVVSQPSVKQVNTPTTKPLNQPVIKLVKEVPFKSKVEAPKTPIEDYTADIKWLMEQPAFNYTLQLANLSDKESALQMIKDKSLEGSKVVIQHYRTATKYLVITGSYADKKRANAASREYKARLGISPWVRKIKDISSKVS